MGGDLAFPEAVRELLLNGARRSETASVVGVAAEHFGERIPVLGHLRAAIADPHDTPDLELTPDSRTDVELESAVMRALSGPYLSRADRLRNSIAQAGGTAGLPESTKSRHTASDTMPKLPEQADPTSDAFGATDSRSASQRQPDPVDPVTTPLTHPGATGPRPFPRRQPDDPPPGWGNVPPRNPNFTGRGELLEQLGKRLTSGTTAVLPSALRGMGGIGKTQMAAEYIYRHLQNYDLVWWLDAAHTTQIRAGLTDLARVLNLPVATETTVAVPAVLEALRTGQHVISLRLSGEYRAARYGEALDGIKPGLHALRVRLLDCPAPHKPPHTSQGTRRRGARGARNNHGLKPDLSNSIQRRSGSMK